MIPLNRYERIVYQKLADEIERQPWKNDMMRWNLRHLKAALNYKPKRRKPSLSSTNQSAADRGTP